MSSRQTCDRCQKPGHAASSCWQKTTISGQQLPPNKSGGKISQFFEAESDDNLNTDLSYEYNEWPEWEETENYFDPNQSDANGRMQALRIVSPNQNDTISNTDKITFLAFITSSFLSLNLFENDHSFYFTANQSLNQSLEWDSEDIFYSDDSLDDTDDEIRRILEEIDQCEDDI